MMLIIVNDNYVPVDFLVMDIEYDPSCPIILGRHFLHTIGAIIDMKEGIIRLLFPLKKAWKISEERISYLLSSLYGLAMLLILIRLDLFASCLAKRRKRKRLLGGNPKYFYFQFYCFLVFVTTVTTSLYLYFQALCQVLASADK